MPTRESAPIGAPCWIDLFTSDPDRAEEFYGRLFGWTAEHTAPEFGGYVNFRREGVLVAGMMRNDGTAGMPDAWTTYLATADAKATAEAVVAAGGQVHLEPMQVLNQGTMAVVADPGGAAIGMWQPDAHTGFGVWGEPGSPFWFELHTRDYAAVLDFYRAAFGVDPRPMSDTDDFRYTQLFVADGLSYAGIMDGSAMLPAGVPGGWNIYLGVDDVDKTLAEAVELGGTVAEPAQTTPFGRLAALKDPTGTPIKLAARPTTP